MCEEDAVRLVQYIAFSNTIVHHASCFFFIHVDSGKVIRQLD